MLAFQLRLLVIYVPKIEIRALSLQSLRVGTWFIGQHISCHISRVTDLTFLEANAKFL